MNYKAIRQKILTTEDTESTEEIKFPLVPTLQRGNRYLGSENDDYAFPRRSMGTSKLQNDSALLAQAINEMKL